MNSGQKVRTPADRLAIAQAGRLPSSSDGDQKPAKKGKDRAASRKPGGRGLCCHQFTKDGHCDVKEKGGTCKYPHLTREEAEKASRAKKPQD